MPRHAKNNTANSFFTSHEKSQLEYGTTKQRLGKESFRSFDCCSLCLKPAQQPKACSKGHLYCKECILTNLVAQKEEIKRQKAAYKHYLAAKEQEKNLLAAEQQRREIEDFDKLECGVLNTQTRETNPKKKEEFDAEVKAELSKKKEKYSQQLTAFWVPGLTPADATVEMKKPSGKVKCPGGNHPLRLKQLYTVEFSPAVAGSSSRFVCPVCNKGITNATTSILLTPCGHVTCNSCFEKIVKDSQSCYVCQKGFMESEHVQLESGGTGFAGHHGKSLEVTKVSPVAWV